MEIKDLNEALKKLDMVEPIIEFVEPTKLQSKHYEALAKMYADQGFREWMSIMFNNSLKSAALRATDNVDSVFGKAQALTYKKILVDAKNAFEYTEKLRLKKIKDAQQDKKSDEGV